MTDLPTDLPSGFKPRRGAIITSGILFGLFGLMLCGFGALSILQYFLMGQIGDLDPENAAELESMQGMIGIGSLVNVTFYGGAGVMMIVIAFGCFFFKRWARPFVLTLSWGWLYTGVLMVISLSLTMGPMKQFMGDVLDAELASAPAGSAPQSMESFFMIGLMLYLGFMIVFLVMVPALVLWLNWGADVRRTLEFRDPLPRWTDRQPAPVIGLTIASIAFVVFSLPSLFMMNQPWMNHFFPFGMIRNVFFLVPLAWAYVAWGSYRGQFAAWAVAVLVLIGGAVIGIYSMQNLDWVEMYKQMGMPEKDVARMAPLIEKMLSPEKMGILMAGSMLPLLGYLIWVVRYFRERAA